VASILLNQLQKYPYPGLYALCGSLRAAGCRYEVLATADSKKLVERVRSMQPDVVGFTCMTGSHRQVLDAAAAVKRSFPHIPVLLGGVHPTLFPAIVEDENVDFVCRGEGEQATVELLRAIEQGRSASDVRNISWKADGEVVHNPLRPLAAPLDALPFPDYSVYRDDPVISSDTYPVVSMIRGCPFSCSYCHNSKLRDLFGGLGSYVRALSIERILDEVEAALRWYPNTRAVNLGADTLGADFGWLHDLLTRYHRRFDVPYTCLVRPEFITEDLVRLLSQTGCHMLAFGIESGSERVRKELLGRNYSNERLLEIGRLLKRHGIRCRTYNVIGFPTETREEMLATLDLNIQLAPEYPWCSIFTPYPGMELAAFAISRGELDPSFDFDQVPVSFFSETVLDRPDRAFISNLHALFQAVVLVPALRRTLEPLLALPPGALHRLVFKTTFVSTWLRSERRSLTNLVTLGWANRRQLVERRHRP